MLRFPMAVTHFSPGSYASRPLQTTSFGNVFMAGDWVKGVPHGANGLSQVTHRSVTQSLSPKDPGAMRSEYHMSLNSRLQTYNWGPPQKLEGLAGVGSANWMRLR